MASGFAGHFAQRATETLSARVVGVIATAYLAMTIVVAMWFWQGWAGAHTTHIVGDLGALTGALFAAGCAGWAARSARGRAQRGWLAMMAGLLVWAVGAFVWSYYEITSSIERLPSPSVADAAFFVFPVCAGAAVCLLWAHGNGQSLIRLLLDAVIVAASLFVVAWVSVFNRVARESGERLSGTVATLTFLTADVVLVTIAVLVWSRARPPNRRSLDLFVGGIILMAATDAAVVYVAGLGSHQVDLVFDLTRLIPFGALGLAALLSLGEPPVETHRVQMPSQVRLWLPYVPFALACGVGLTQLVPSLGSGPLLVASVILVFGVLGRQFVVLAENRRLLSDVGRLAFRDQLTGLANRAMFLDRLGHAVARQRRELMPVAVLCLDLDDFKRVNDELGHPAGDELLIRIAGRLNGTLRSTDTVARLGGDEFAVLIEGSVDDALVVADRVLDAFASPIVVDGVALTVRPSVGLTLATADTSPTVDGLLRQADLAMYAAKRDGGGCLRSFVPDLPYPYDLPQLEVPASRSTPPIQPATSVDPAPSLDAAASTEPQPESVPAPTRWPPVRVRLALAIVAIGVVLFAISTLVRSPGRNVLLDSWLYAGLSLSAAGLVTARAFRVAAERWAWLLIAAGMALSALGDIAYALWVPQGASPSVADPMYLAFYPLAYAGLLLLIRIRLKHVPAAIMLDAVVAGLAVAAVAVALASGPIAAAVKGSPATVLVGLAYPAGDLLLLALATGTLAILEWRTEWRWGLLVGGFVLYAVADTIYLFQTAQGSYLEGTWVDACWPAASLLVAVASWLPASAGVRSRPGSSLGSLVAPVACTVVALAVCVFANDVRVAVALAALSLTAVAARFAVTFRDVSSLAESHQQAMTDELTGLANRRALATALTSASFDESASSTSGRAQPRLALLLLDLDQFKEINHSLGRHVGDQLLRRIANRLSGAVRSQDLLARTDGDEFGVLLADAIDQTTARAQAACLMEALKEPFALDYITVQVDASIAIAVYPDHCAYPKDLLTVAEAALPLAKTAAGGLAVCNTAAVHNGNVPQLVEDLRAALHAGELTCHYQPKISASDESVHSVEALARWHHPSRGLLLPDQFLPAAEQAGLMRPVTSRVLDIALAQIRSWRDQGTTLTVAVNLSTTNLLDLGLVETIDELLRKYDLPGEALILEITESTLATDSQRSRSTVAALRQLGIRLSLDDYGTGWSSLARLQDLSVDELKLDKVFVARLARDPRSIAIVRSTVALTHSLGADLVAEGVEDAATLSALRRYGCNITQGFVHCPPLPPAEFEQWLATFSPERAPTGSQQ